MQLTGFLAAEPNRQMLRFALQSLLTGGESVRLFIAASAEDVLAFWRLFGLKPEHAAYLTQFSRTRRMKRAPAKAALLGFTKAWAKEFAPWNIHVNAIAPGGVRSGGPLKKAKRAPRDSVSRRSHSCGARPRAAGPDGR